MKPTTFLRFVPALALAGTLAPSAFAGDDFPPFDTVADGFEKVVSTADGHKSLYTLYTREKDAQILAELPADFESQKIFIHNVVSGGNPLAGVGLLMSGEHYVYWKRIGDKLALMEPELGVRATGDNEDKKSQAMMFTDRVVASVPIVTTGPGGGPVIDLDALFLGQSTTFFGPLTAGADQSLARINKAKAFPQNIEVALELPLAQRASGGPLFGLDMAPQSGGRMTELHYSISLVPQNTGYKPREADPRVGYFTTAFNDMSKTTSGPKTWTRYITRWRLEKADPSLKLSPPKEPLVWYIEHTTPIKYRRFIRGALEEWNKAFEKVGLVGAIEVRQQDSRSGAYMDVDPEDVRYNFIRWNNNQASFAIGPSRANPETGEIFDADVTINAGIFGSFSNGLRALLPAIAMEGFPAETVSWLDENPRWDPRVRLAPPETRQEILSERAARVARGEKPVYPPGYTAGIAAHLREEWVAAGLTVDDHTAACLAGAYAALGTNMVRLLVEEGADEEGAEGEEATDTIDGLPESYVEQLLRWLTLHEVGHCLGLKHNFMGSTIYDLAEINSKDFPSDRATGGSVMEYTPPNINHGLGEVQGQWVIQNVGPYDYWVIEYGYGLGDDLAPVLDRSSEPEHVFGDNLDMVGADPRVRTYDFGKDPIQFCESRMSLIGELRGKIVDDLVKDGEGWGEARDAYFSLLGQHVTALSIVANWIGGTTINKDVKGQTNARPPIENLSPETQRRALDFVITNAFDEEAFGLSKELLHHLTIDRWGDLGDRGTWNSDPAMAVHDLVIGVQSAALTMVMNPTTLRRVFDNEFRIPAGEDAITLPEVMTKVVNASFSELRGEGQGDYSARKPFVSSTRRNLQTEVVDRLIDFSMQSDGPNAATRTLASLSRAKLREVREALDTGTQKAGAFDPYTDAHFSDLSEKIGRALDAQFVLGD